MLKSKNQINRDVKEFKDLNEKLLVFSPESDDSLNALYDYAIPLKK